MTTTCSGFRALRGAALDGGELEVGVRLGQRHLHAAHLRGSDLHDAQVGSRYISGVLYRSM